MDKLTQQHSLSFVLPEPASVKSDQKWAITLGPKGKLHTYEGDRVVVHDNQVVIYPGLQPQWVVLNFNHAVANVEAGHYKIVPSDDEYAEREGRVRVGGVYGEEGINNSWNGVLTLYKDDSGKFTISFGCESEYKGEWEIKNCEIIFSL